MPSNQNPQPTTFVDPRIIPAYYRDDEVSLVDLWLTIARRKKLVLGVLFSTILVGVVAAFVIPKSFTYSTTINVSQYWNGGGFVQVESPESVKAKLEDLYIPQASLKGDPENPIKVQVEIPKNSALIVLKSKTAEASADRVTNLHASIVQSIATEHEQLLANIRVIYEHQLKAAQTEVNALESTAKEGSLTLLLDKKRQIDDLKAKLAGMSPTETRQLAMRSAEATTPGKALVIALSGFLGLFAGFFAAFIAEFRDKVRERIAEEEINELNAS